MPAVSLIHLTNGLVGMDEDVMPPNPQIRLKPRRAPAAASTPQSPPGTQPNSDADEEEERDQVQLKQSMSEQEMVAFADACLDRPDEAL